jgi:two-component system OmpR family response regulator
LFLQGGDERVMFPGVMDEARHILVVDDDEELHPLLSDVLARGGYRVSAALNGIAMMQTLDAEEIDLIILDVTMPGEDGLSLCRRLRVSSTIPIIMFTALGSETDRVVGLELGADDYLPKPFSTRELLARVRAVLRRPPMRPPDLTAGARRVFEFGGWRFDVTRRQLHSPARALVDLRPAEYSLLLAFVERPQSILTRDQLLDLARGGGTTAFDRSIDVHISRLRQRIEVDPKDPKFIKTVRGGGYMFTALVRLGGALR